MKLKPSETNSSNYHMLSSHNVCRLFRYLTNTEQELKTWSEDSLKLVRLTFYIAKRDKLINPDDFQALSQINEKINPWERQLQKKALEEVQRLLEIMKKEKTLSENVKGGLTYDIGEKDITIDQYSEKKLSGLHSDEGEHENN